MLGGHTFKYLTYINIFKSPKWPCKIAINHQYYYHIHFTDGKKTRKIEVK